MPGNDLQDLAKQLVRLEERQLVFVLPKALPGFRPFGGEPSVERWGLFLGAFAVADGKTDLAIVAYPDAQTSGDDRGRTGACARAGRARFQGSATSPTARTACHRSTGARSD